MPRLLTLCAALAVAACSSGSVQPADDTGLDGLSLTALAPGTLVPGSALLASGASFVDAPYGRTVVRLVGTFEGAQVDVSLPVAFVDYQRLSIAWTGGKKMGFPGDDGTFQGHATVEVDSTIDQQIHRSAPYAVTLRLAASLTPRLDRLTGDGTIFVNSPIGVEADGLLIGGDEGQTVALVSGCFQPDGTATCVPITPVAVPVTPDAPYDRQRGSFPFHPRVAGIKPGHFMGQVKLENRHGPAAGGVRAQSAAAATSDTLSPPVIFSVSPTAASLGQYVDIAGGGFIGPEMPDELDAVTTLEFTGSFTPEGTTTAVPVTVTLVPDFVAGPHVRYALNTDDDLGQRIDLRTQAGSFTGTIRPVISLGTDSVTGDPAHVTFGIAHVKQVVWLRFLPSYVESLRRFGLRALDAQIRERVLVVARRDYAGLNVEFRTEPPTDFAYYATVDISGPDVNDLGFFGYDNTPGKDVGNQRLYDHIGGFNALTQADGNPGYGGVFVESMFSFSMHPNGLARPIDGATPIFDQVFDPFRPDVGGAPVLGADLAHGVTKLDTGATCPGAGGDRQAEIACAVWVLGSMIGTTMTHELGHSFGLADPYGDAQTFHDPGDQPNRLMDAGGARTFNERAELMGEGPARFCDAEYEYLRQILPSPVAPPAIDRPVCD